jgi:KaiC/GvpD/RAD55 family RecA-like ATPase
MQTALDGAAWKNSRENDIALFIECCRMARYAEPGYRTNKIQFRTSEIDPEYLLSQLFGIPSGIEGLDELFGGAGMILTETLPQHPAPLPAGRAILIKGRSGTGKSLLASQIASSVVRKGGLARIIAMEQPASDYLYSLASFGVLPSDTDVEIITDPDELAKTREKVPDNERGTLVILGSAKESFEEFRILFEATGTMISPEYPLRVVCVDPVNSIQRGKESVEQQRREFLESILRVKRAGTNVVLVAEEGPDSQTINDFEENIVDVVIHLKEMPRYDYSQRYLQVSKSRLQREQRGWHPYSIRTTAGLTVFPSSSAMNARIQTRRVHLKEEGTRFGFADLDNLLSHDGVNAGDVIAFRGTTGSYKSMLGLMFLAFRDRKARQNSGESKSLLISSGDTEASFRRQLHATWFEGHCRREKTATNDDVSGERILFASPPLGHVNPAFILREIENEFERAKLKGYTIDRVVVDNIGHWELSCPFVRDDETFADTLVSLLQKHNVTSLFICGDPAENTPVQSPILDRADLLVSFEHFEFRGHRRVALRVLKTRSMKHPRQAEEITFDNDIIALNSTASMFRVGPGGQASMVPVRLFLHGESEAQKHYNDKLEAMIQAVLSTDTTVRPQSEVSVAIATDLGNFSAIDELQLIHVDEFQLSDIKDRLDTRGPLHVFKKEIWNKNADIDWDDFVPRLSQAVASTNDMVFGVPFYADIGLLAYRSKDLDLGILAQLRERLDPAQTWKALADACARWEAEQEAEQQTQADNQLQPQPEKLFFEFSHVTGENYSCLFFEILDAFAGAPKTKRSGAQKANDDSDFCYLLKWLDSNNPQVVGACWVYWRLCQKAHRLDLKRRHDERVARKLRPGKLATGTNTRAFNLEEDSHLDNEKPKDEEYEVFHVCQDALVWRHWFSTLNQMLAQMGPDKRRGIEVTVLPGRATAGEWYMVIPSYSAAPEVAVRLLTGLTGRQANLERFHLGVGLPTCMSFYKQMNAQHSPDGRDSVAPQFFASPEDVGNAIENAFCRSEFSCYSDYAELIAYHLMRLLELDLDPEQGEAKIRQVLDSLCAELRFSRPKQRCKKCCDRNAIGPCL